MRAGVLLIGGAGLANWHPASVDGAKPALAAHKMRQQWYVAWQCGPRWTHCYVVSEQHVSPTGAGPVDNLYSQ